MVVVSARHVFTALGFALGAVAEGETPVGVGIDVSGHEGEFHAVLVWNFVPFLADEVSGAAEADLDRVRWGSLVAAFHVFSGVGV